MRELTLIEAPTFFAPSARESLATVQEQSDVLQSSNLGQHLLDAIPDIAVILNDKRQIVAANEHFLAVLGVTSLADVLGCRPGEAFHCVHAKSGPGGCGTSKACQQCGIAKSILECLESADLVQRECRIVLEADAGGNSFELLAKANFVSVGDHPLVLLVLRDISAEKRREVLEKIFFHDVLNSVGGLAGLAGIMVSQSGEDSAHTAQTIQHLAEAVAEEVSAFRDLTNAEMGKLSAHPTTFNLLALLSEVKDGLEYHPQCPGREFVVRCDSDLQMVSDRTLLRRVLLNLGKNAAEAIKRGQKIEMSCRFSGGKIILEVANPGEIPAHVQSQIFGRSFSTKGGTGRGLGTYSIRLLVERYLRGTVGFVSNPEVGTVFRVELPSDWSF